MVNDPTDMNERRLLPSVDVIIPVFNRSAELARALNSLACQSDPCFGVIVCDDGSSEDISAVTQQFSDRLNLELIRIENSGGPARPRNQGVARSQAIWVSFLDSDDWWFPDRMALIREALRSEYDLVYHQLQEVRPEHNTLNRKSKSGIIGSALHGSDPLLQMVRSGNPIPTSACIVRRKSLIDIGGFDESSDLASVEDFDAWLRICMAGARLKFIPTRLGAYWIGDDQISTFNEKQMKKQENLFKKQLELLPQRYKNTAESNFNYLLGSYAAAIRLPNARQYFAGVSLWLEPTRWFKAQAKILRTIWQART
ncbi:glycosyltransferase involved in cell wall biosynthesis [Sphingorhabdus rigui]|uniref:Glycosyltransferase involved in cell wall biosynthesis n=1 Tax=Sphingorhabdus rigui TaxID=1282858 RepID=A0A840B0W3_9SPHN|nr:glycosyltransferase family A protein [Sphingorhabdus rigui]MBB3943998.1 glycosyltransferase involved in cell wall biosynthesis [Sphingorhabdus rigui]